MENEQISDLFCRYGDDVFRLALSYLGNRADAEDVCQNVFLKLTASRITLYPGKEKAWLFTCTANACKNQLKCFWRKNVIGTEEEIPFAQKEERDLYAALMTLPARYRAVIHLYYFEGYSQGEISEILRISKTAVQTRMSRARNKLKEALSDETDLPHHDGTEHPVR